MSDAATASIRRATRADRAALLELVRQYWAFERIDGFEPDAVGGALDRLLDDTSLGGAWIAHLGERPVGYLLAVVVFSLEHRGLTAEIDELFIVPDARGERLGARLLDIAEAALAEIGCCNVSLQLGRANETARAFYRRRGFRERSGYELIEKDLAPTGSAISVHRVEVAPDGARVRLLQRTKRGQLSRFTLAPGETARAIEHRSVDELWYVVSGRGELWRRVGSAEEIVDLVPGASASIPCGARFQFRNTGDAPLEIVAATMPPWPGDDEAIVIEGRWPSTHR